MKGVWAFLKTREWSVAVVPPFDPYLINQSIFTKPWASVLFLVVLFLELIRDCTTDCVRHLWVPRR